MICAVHMAYPEHTMRMIVSVVNVRIHVEIIHAQKVRNVLLICALIRKSAQHLHQFVAKVQDKLGAVEKSILIQLSLKFQLISPAVVRYCKIAQDAILNVILMLTVEVRINVAQQGVDMYVYHHWMYMKQYLKTFHPLYPQVIVMSYPKSQCQ